MWSQRPRLALGRPLPTFSHFCTNYWSCPQKGVSENLHQMPSSWFLHGNYASRLWTLAYFSVNILWLSLGIIFSMLAVVVMVCISLGYIMIHMNCMLFNGEVSLVVGLWNMHVVADWIIFGYGIFSSAPPLDMYFSYHQHISITCRTRLHVID